MKTNFERKLATMEELILKRYEFACHQEMDGQMFAEMPNVKVFEDIMTGNIRAFLKQSVFGVAGQTVEIEYPLDWWQAFKERFFPKWALQRWPVLKTHHRIETATLFPKIAAPKRDPFDIRLAYVKPEFWSDSSCSSRSTSHE